MHKSNKAQQSALITPQTLTGTSDDHIEWLAPNIGLHKHILPAFNQMQAAAQKVGLSIEIASGFRPFDRQLSIWNRKFTGELAVKNQANEVVDITKLNEKEKVEAILLYSALPGTSRHHWGTDFDIYAPDLLPTNQKLQLEPWEYQQTGYFWPLTTWLNEYADTFGFSRPYQKFTGGVAIEPWHLSHQITANSFEQYYSLTDLARLLKTADIEGKDFILQHIEALYQRFVVQA